MEPYEPLTKTTLDRRGLYRNIEVGKRRGKRSQPCFTGDDEQVH